MEIFVKEKFYNRFFAVSGEITQSKKGFQIFRIDNHKQISKYSYYKQSHPTRLILPFPESIFQNGYFHCQNKDGGVKYGVPVLQ